MSETKEVAESNSSLVRHAKRELEIIGAMSAEGDFYGGMTGKAVLELVEVFAAQGHSGMSAPMVLDLFKTVASYKPLAPLTGEESEWNDVSEMSGKPHWQNNRCSRVFKDGDGSAYDIDGKVFRYPDGGCYTNGDSRVSVTFPYTPTTEYVDVPEEAPDA